MKQFTLTLCLGLFFSFAYSQPVTKEKLLDELLSSMKAYEDQFNCNKDANVKEAKVVSDPTFDSVYKLASSRILTSSQDFIKNGRAAALDFNEATKKLTINYSWKESNNIWNAGLVAEEGSKKLFEIFGKKGWKEGFTFNFGKAIPVLNRSILFMPTDCELLRKERKKHYFKLLDSYAKVLATSPKAIDELRSKTVKWDQFNLQNIGTYTDAPAIVLESEAKLLEQWDTLQHYLSDPSYLKYVNNIYLKDVSNFEVLSFKNFGYKLHWFNWNIALGLKRFTIYDTAVINLASIKKRNLGRITATGSYNFFQESADKNLTKELTNKSITYFLGEVSVGNTNYLEEMLPSEITDLKSTTTPLVVKDDYEALILKNYERLKKNYLFVNPGVVVNYFPGTIGKLGRFLGFEFAASTKLKFLVPKGVDAKDVFSVRGGLLFTFESEKVAKTTFGLIASLSDIPFNDITSKDRFGVNIRIGVPFNYE
jgi:hypothetical protein